MHPIFAFQRVHSGDTPVYGSQRISTDLRSELNILGLPNRSQNLFVRLALQEHSALFTVGRALSIGRQGDYAATWMLIPCQALLTEEWERRAADFLTRMQQALDLSGEALVKHLQELEDIDLPLEQGRVFHRPPNATPEAEGGLAHALCPDLESLAALFRYPLQRIFYDFKAIYGIQMLENVDLRLNGKLIDLSAVSTSLQIFPPTAEARRAAGVKSITLHSAAGENVPFDAPITIPAGDSISISWTHQLGYAPIERVQYQPKRSEETLTCPSEREWFWRFDPNRIEVYTQERGAPVRVPQKSYSLQVNGESPKREYAMAALRAGLSVRVIFSHAKDTERYESASCVGKFTERHLQTPLRISLRLRARQPVKESPAIQPIRVAPQSENRWRRIALICAVGLLLSLTGNIIQLITRGPKGRESSNIQQGTSTPSPSSKPQFPREDSLSENGTPPEDTTAKPQTQSLFKALSDTMILRKELEHWARGLYDALIEYRFEEAIKLGDLEKRSGELSSALKKCRSLAKQSKLNASSLERCWSADSLPRKEYIKYLEERAQLASAPSAPKGSGKGASSSRRGNSQEGNAGNPQSQEDAQRGNNSVTPDPE